YLIRHLGNGDNLRAIEVLCLQVLRRKIVTGLHVSPPFGWIWVGVPDRPACHPLQPREFRKTSDAQSRRARRAISLATAQRFVPANFVSDVVEDVAARMSARWRVMCHLRFPRARSWQVSCGQ